MNEYWLPPVRFFAAGRQIITSMDYHHECRNDNSGIRRLLIKRTLRGSGVIYASRKRYKLTEGMIFMIQRPGPYVYCYEGDGAPWEFEYVALVLPHTGDWLPSGLKKNPVWFMPKSSQSALQMTKLVDRVMQKELPRDISGRLNYLDNESIRESSTVYKFYLSCLAGYLQPEESVHHAVAALRDYLQQNFSEQVHLSKICKELDYTPEALSRLFKQAYSLSPMQYLIRLRLDMARKMVAQTDFPLKQIAHECGFESLNYLCRIFKRHFNITPGQYRRNPDPLLQIK